VAGAVQHLDGCPRRSLDRIAKPSCGRAEILTARCPRGDVPLSLSGIGTGGQKLRYQCWGFGRDLIDCPDACGRLAELADGISRLSVCGPQFSHESATPRDEILERSSIQAGGVHDQQCETLGVKPGR
jgi:hypothetical protein